MNKVTIVIPNWNGKEYLRKCLDSLMSQSIGQVPVIVVDNGSEDGSPELMKKEYPWVQLICMDQNYGFCKAVNTGIRAAETKYVILLNNDIVADRDFVKYLLLRAEENPRFPVSQKCCRWIIQIILTMRGMSTAHLAGRIPEEKMQRQNGSTGQNRFFLPAEVRCYIVRRYLMRSGFLMKHILLIWKMWTSDTGQRSADMRTGMSQHRSYIIRGVQQPAPDTMPLKLHMHPEIIFT